MKLKEIVAIAGVSGLHKIIGRTKSGLILESLAEPKKRFPTSMQDRVSVLEDIAMYTVEGDMRLAEVFVKINEQETKGKTIPTGKDDNKTQRAFLVDTIQLDSERVYDSDIKKLLNWYSLLKSMLDFATLMDEEEATETKEAAVEEAPKPEPKKTAAKKEKAPDDAEKPKKTAAKKTAKSAGEEGEAKPKTTRKKKTEE